MDVSAPVSSGVLDPNSERLLEDARSRAVVRLVGRERVTRWLGALLFVLAAASLAALAPVDRHVSAAVVVLLVGSYAIASRVEFEVGSGFAIPTEFVLVPMLFTLPSGYVPLAVAGGLALGQLPASRSGRTVLERVVVVVASSWYSLGPALVLVELGRPVARPDDWWIVGVALGAQFAIDLASTTTFEWLALRVAPRDVLPPMGWVVAVDTLLAPLGLATAVAATTTRLALLLPLPLLGLLGLFAHERKRSLDNALELSAAYQGTAYLLGDLIEADDLYTGSHSRAVVELVLSVADRLRLDQRQRRVAEFTALLHDVGKIAIPNEILNKRGPLNDREWAIIRTHTIEGERLLARIGGQLTEVARTVRACHERFDGEGYPDGLAGDAIPLIARIVACCDAYHAMTSDRPYRSSRTTAQAIAELTANSGSQFDPAVVDALVAALTS